MSADRGSSAGHLRAAASCITPGVWATAVPFSSFLGYSFSYTVRVPNGIIVIDLGWESDEAWDVFLLGLARASATLDEVVGVVVTHTHPDHFGLAARMKSESAAWIAGHEGELQNMLATRAARHARVADIAVWLTLCGVPAETVVALGDDAASLTDVLPRVDFDFTIQDGDLIPESEGSLLAIHTPGHTPGHLCFRDERRGLLFTGDHLLPRVTPNVSKRPGSLDDPLLAYQRSNDALSSFSGDLVLPGHEWPFENAPERMAAIRDFDLVRSDEVVALVRRGVSTVWGVAEALAWSRPFETLNVRGKRQAIGETHAHLHRLASAGSISAHEKAGILRFTRCDDPAPIAG